MLQNMFPEDEDVPCLRLPSFADKRDNERCERSDNDSVFWRHIVTWKVAHKENNNG